MELISQGAEAKIYENEGNILKKRMEKPYRIKEIDDRLRKSRTNREAKVLERLKGIAPELLKKEDYTIIMEKIDGRRLSEHLEELDYRRISRRIGEMVREVHDKNIIHGDLTTSNFILKDNLYIIDFGLSFFSHKLEDMAVDLYLLKRAIRSKHHTIAEECINEVMKGYNPSDELRKRLEKVEKRGRNKAKSY